MPTKDTNTADTNLQPTEPTRHSLAHRLFRTGGYTSLISLQLLAVYHAASLLASAPMSSMSLGEFGFAIQGLFLVIFLQYRTNYGLISVYPVVIRPVLRPWNSAEESTTDQMEAGNPSSNHNLK